MVPVPIAATIMVGVLHGLHAAHEARDERGDPLRIVHRDVSPHNILVGTDGDAHLIDFGIAKARGRMQVTRQGQIKGKLSYMPAEQLMGQGLDHRADIFAASIVLWESLTGQRLFQGVDDGDVYAKVLLGKVDPPSLHAKGLSPALDAIVLRGLARDRAQRYATAREMALAIEAAIPLAPPSHVGRWVEGLVGDSLAERTEQIAGIERLVDAGADATSSALMTIGAGTSRPANQQNDGVVTGARSTALSRMDRTSPTQPLGVGPAGMTDPTVVDRPAGMPVLKDADVVSSAPRRGPRRVLLAFALLLAPAAAYGGFRALRSPGVTAIAAPIMPPTSVAGVSPVDTHTAAPAQLLPASQASSDWHPVPTSPPLPTQTTSEQARTAIPADGAKNADGARRASPPAAQSARATAPRGQAAPQATSITEEATATAGPRTPPPNVSSCNPPFYIDADGTKRYKRYCANL